VESSNFGCAVVNNELFIVGGCYNQSLQEEHIHPFGFRFSPRHNKWHKLTPMAKESCRFSLTVFGAKFLYAIGGCFEATSDYDDPDHEGIDQGDLERGSCERLVPVFPIY
jgi:N-acetylneuraminic acid mutarotase